MQATGIEFPAVTHFWEGEAFRSLGAAARQKKIAFVGVKVCDCCLGQPQHAA